MKRLLFALASVLVLAMAQAGLATAGPPPVQTAAQLVQSAQDASASAQSAQLSPKNGTLSVRVLSPGNDGPVSQTNSSQALALGVNRNDTDQSATQSQGGGYGSGPAIQPAAQQAENTQDADATANSTQREPKNGNLSVRVLSEGDNGPVTQQNSSWAGALAANKNDTDQTAEQTQGGGSGSASVQAAGQSAKNDQDADATANSWQDRPKNGTLSVRVLSPGNDGPVSQTNSSQALALGVNRNDTDQTATQSQGGGSPSCEKCQPCDYGCQEPCSQGYDASGAYGCVDPCDYGCSEPCSYKCHEEGPAVQAGGQVAESTQDADATANSTQREPENGTVPVLVGSVGGGGSTEQRNDSRAAAVAADWNKLLQALTQDQGGSTLDLLPFGWFPLRQ